jgi:predicted phage gp36 major capsid-like protein
VYGGWHGGCGNEQWTSRTTHNLVQGMMRRSSRTTSDERFDHLARTWASSSHRKFTHAAVGIAMVAATFRFMQATAKTAMRRVLGIRGGQGETLVPPIAVAGGDEGFVFEFERHPTTTTAANKVNTLCFGK